MQAVLNAITLPCCLTILKKLPDWSVQTYPKIGLKALVLIPKLLGRNQLLIDNPFPLYKTLDPEAILSALLSAGHIFQNNLNLS